MDTKAHRGLMISEQHNHVYFHFIMGERILKRLTPGGSSGLLLVLLLALCSRAGPAAAQTATPGAPPGLEVDLGHFVLLADPLYADEVNALAQQYGPELGQAYLQLEKLYGTSLTLPLNIRLYADWPQFISLNSTLTPLLASPYHTHVGTREIALIGPLPPGLLVSTAGVNMIRHELSGLFLDSLSANNIPPGLALGLNQYVEIPGDQAEAAAIRLRAVLPSGAAGVLRWPDLMEGPTVHFDRDLASAQALSVVAFLVDQYGFEALLEVVRGLGEGHSYRSAMSGTFGGQSLEQLEAAWLQYLPTYVETGWQYNALYNYNLAPYEAALDAGAYSQAAEALDRLLPFLEATGQASALAQAQVLREEARQGLAARELTAALGEALQTGQYEQALDLALQAQAAYAAIGDAANASLAGAHADYLQQILTLRAELAAVQARAAAGPNAQVESELLVLVPKFQNLGDAEGERQAVETLNGLYAQQATQVEQRRDFSRQIITIAATVALALLALEAMRSLAARRRREPHIL